MKEKFYGEVCDVFGRANILLACKDGSLAASVENGYSCKKGFSSG
jgi:hypothetical protein